jgi:hypothetical protein
VRTQKHTLDGHQPSEPLLAVETAGRPNPLVRVLLDCIDGAPMRYILHTASAELALIKGRPLLTDIGMVRLAQTQNRLRSTISRIGDHEQDGSGQRRQAMKREQCDGARDTNDEVVTAFIHSVMGHPYTVRLHSEQPYSSFLLGQATKVYRKLPKLIASSGGPDLRCSEVLGHAAIAFAGTPRFSSRVDQYGRCKNSGSAFPGAAVSSSQATLSGMAEPVESRT